MELSYPVVGTALLPSASPAAGRRTAYGAEAAAAESCSEGAPGAPGEVRNRVFPRGITRAVGIL